jgi:hypothetical protein
LDQAKAPEWHEAMVAANIDIFEMSYEESVAYFKRLENLEKIKKTNGMAPLPVDNKKTVGSSVDRSKVSSLWCHHNERNNHNTANCGAVAKMKEQKNVRFETKAAAERKSLAFFLKKSMPSRGS